MTHSGDALAPGTRVGHFVIERFLGRGGFGVTYLARDEALGVRRALKEYLPQDWGTRLADGTVGPRTEADAGDYRQGLEQFVREARVVARLDQRHVRHVVRVYGGFEAGGTAYMVMEYVEGRTLEAEVAAEGPLSGERMRGLLLALTEGLSAVHAEGFLHCDITPRNVMLLEDGTPILIDFGSARQAMGERSGDVRRFLTPPFAPVEQYVTTPRRGSSSSVKLRQGPWTDIYALGAVAYWALSREECLEKLDEAPARLLADDLPPLSEAASAEVDVELASAVDAALSVMPEDRPQSLTEWRAMLSRSPAAVSRVERSSWWSSRRTAYSLAAATALLVVAAGVAGWLTAGQPRTAEGEGETGETSDPMSDRLRTRLQAFGREPRFNLAFRSGETPLHVAAWFDARDVVAELLRRGADIEAKDENGHTPLHMAANGNAVGSLAELLGRGADINATVHGGQTPLFEAVHGSALEAADFLVGRGADVDAQDDNGRTPLFDAAIRNVRIVALLLGRGADIHARDNTGVTSLHLAAQYNADGVVAELLERGANIEMASNAGYTPLHWAALLSSPEAVEAVGVLLERGADVHAKADSGSTPLIAAANANAVRTVALLLERGADVHARSNGGVTPLHHAAQNNADGVVAELLEHGVSIEVANNAGYTPLHWASSAEAVEAVVVLLERGADVHARASDGVTPLHRAARNNADGVVAELLEHGANIEVASNAGYTPLHYAAWQNAREAAEVLL